MLLKYTIKDNRKVTKSISVALAQYDFVEYWRDYVVRIAEKTPHVTWYFAGVNNNRQEAGTDILIGPLKQLYNNYSYFVLLGINVESFTEILREIEFLLKYPEFVNQYHLNKFHRTFTKLELKYLKDEYPLPNNADPKVFWQNVQDLNGYTHHMEGYTYRHLNRRKQYKDFLQYSVQFTNAANLAYATTVCGIFDKENIENIDERFTFDFFKQDYNYNVWLHEDITGKDQMKAWLDEDDLNEFDITGNILLTPSLCFDPHNVYKSILDDESFRTESKNSNKPINRFPIGKIVEANDIIWDDLFTSEVLKVELAGKILWSK